MRANSKRILGAKLGEAVLTKSGRGDVWDTAWAKDRQLYVISDDTYGFDNACFSNLAFHQLTGDDPFKLEGRTINSMQEYGPLFGISEIDRCCWKALSVASIDGTLYMTVARHRYGMEGVDPMKRQQSHHASIIKSDDKGLTWTRTAGENLKQPTFYAYRFGAPCFVKYGFDGAAAAVDNADQYVYAVSNNGYWDNGDHYVLGRVLRTELPKLAGGDWEFYTGGDGIDAKNWSKIVYDALPILNSPGKCSMTGMQYIEQLDRYVLIQWYYTAGSGETGHQETIWEFYEAPAPWGPWNKFAAFLFYPEGYYNPFIVPKFTSQDGKSLIIFTGGDFITNQRSDAENIYRLTTISCELRTE